MRGVRLRRWGWHVPCKRATYQMTTFHAAERAEHSFLCFSPYLLTTCVESHAVRSVAWRVVGMRGGGMNQRKKAGTRYSLMPTDLHEIIQCMIVACLVAAAIIGIPQLISMWMRWTGWFV